MTPPLVLYGDRGFDSSCVIARPRFPPRAGRERPVEIPKPFRQSTAARGKNAYGQRMNFSRLSTPQRISAVSILVVALAAFLPWVSIFGMGVSGIEGDGVITLVLAIAGGVVLALTTGVIGEQKVAGKKSQISLLVLAALVALIGLMDMNGAAAIGLYLTLFGGVAWVVGAVWQLSATKNDATKAEESSAPH